VVKFRLAIIQLISPKDTVRFYLKENVNLNESKRLKINSFMEMRAATVRIEVKCVVEKIKTTALPLILIFPKDLHTATYCRRFLFYLTCQKL
jgi:hypothetical protein